MQFRFTQALTEQVAQDPSLQARLQTDPVETLRSLTAPPPLQTDVWIYRIVVTSLSLVVLLALGGALYLSGNGGVDIPDVVTALGSAAVGALAGLLAPSPTTQATGQ